MTWPWWLLEGGWALVVILALAGVLFGPTVGDITDEPEDEQWP